MLIKMFDIKKYSYIEQDIYKDEIADFDAVFLTGTSINVLPVKSINNTHYDSVNNELVRSLINDFNKFTNEYIDMRRKYE